MTTFSEIRLFAIRQTRNRLDQDGSVRYLGKGQLVAFILSLLDSIADSVFYVATLVAAWHLNATDLWEWGSDLRRHLGRFGGPFGLLRAPRMEERCAFHRSCLASAARACGPRAQFGTRRRLRDRPLRRLQGAEGSIKNKSTLI
jgi:hypothetical protein